MTQVIPYISVNNALAALNLYDKIFDISNVNRTPVTEEQLSFFDLSVDTDLSKTTIHGEFTIDGNQLYISDNFSGEILDKRNVSILLECDSLARAEEIFANAKEVGCTITMELEEQFWGDHFGSFVDPFGISWQLNYDPDSKD